MSFRAALRRFLSQLSQKHSFDKGILCFCQLPPHIKRFNQNSPGAHLRICFVFVVHFSCCRQYCAFREQLTSFCRGPMCYFPSALTEGVQLDCQPELARYTLQPEMMTLVTMAVMQGLIAAFCATSPHFLRGAGQCSPIRDQVASASFSQTSPFEPLSASI